MSSRKSDDDSLGEGSPDRAETNRGVKITLVQAVERLMAEFAYRIDFEQGFTIAELFSPDGYYESDGKRSTGRAAIHQAYVRRAARGPRTSRHLFTNVRVVRLPGEKYGATAIMLLFARDGEGLHPAVPLSVADVADVYALDGGSADNGLPLIESRTLRTIFADENESPVLPLGQET
jgi:SnoaL-like domain